MKLKPLALIATALLACQAQAATVLYDDFNVLTGLDRVKWNDSEAARFIDNGRLTLGRFLYGSTSSDAGLTLESWGLSMPVTAPIKGLRGNLKVADIKQDEPCAANGSVGQSTARLISSHFNIRAGGPVPGDRTGDVLAQVRVRRTSNSTDPVGTLQVQATLSQCANADCSVSTSVPGATSPMSLGTVTVGTPIKLQYAWDKKANSFTYVRDGVTTVTISYDASLNVSVAPAVVFATASLRNEIQNCTTQRTKGGIVSYFDNIYLTN